MTEHSAPHIEGFIEIRDVATNEILVAKHNAIHEENLTEALALAIANRSTGHIHEMVFGNGGTVVSNVGIVEYHPPNTAGQDAQLYSQTYRKVVDDQSPLNSDPARNFLQVRHTQGRTYTDVVVTAILDYQEPAGQDAFDAAASASGDYIFDELGLKSFNPIPGAGRLLTHVVFHPVQKSLNRQIQVIYIIRIAIAAS